MYLYAVPVTLNVLFLQKMNLEAQSYTVWHLRVVDFFASMFCSHRYFMIYLVKKYWLVNQSIF